MNDEKNNGVRPSPYHAYPVRCQYAVECFKWLTAPVQMQVAELERMFFRSH